MVFSERGVASGPEVSVPVCITLSLWSSAWSLSPESSPFRVERLSSFPLGGVGLVRVGWREGVVPFRSGAVEEGFVWLGLGVSLELGALLGVREGVVAEEPLSGSRTGSGLFLRSGSRSLTVPEDERVASLVGLES